MSEPIKRVYVIEIPGGDNPFLSEKLRAANDLQQALPTSVMRVFVEEVPWVVALGGRALPPDTSRTVLALYRPHHRPLTRARLITAEYGSEGKWLAIDHDFRLTELDPGTVLGWREMPEVPEQFTHRVSP